ncbi:Hypothetical protein NocV09_01700710 [Nannochloropsis oceanica]
MVAKRGGAKARKVFLFDLDGTLYPNENGYRDHILNNLWEYMHEHLGIPRSTPAEDVWRPLFNKYHQSFRAFKAQGWIEDSQSIHYWRYIRKDVNRFLSPDAELDVFLSALPKECPKYIFTNAREEQAMEALVCLGVERHFDGVYGSDHMGDYCKPEKEAFEKVLAALPVSSLEGEGEKGREVVLFEDSFKNLMAAKELGMKTILIYSKTTVKEEGRSEADFHTVDAVLPRLTLPIARKKASFLWEGFEK